MSKPLLIYQAPVATRSGYGDHARDILKLDQANVLNSYDEKYHVYDHEYGAYIQDDKQRRRRGILYATIIAAVFIASHYMAIHYVDDEGSAGFYPPYIEKRVVYPELYKDKTKDGNLKSKN